MNRLRTVSSMKAGSSPRSLPDRGGRGSVLWTPPLSSHFQSFRVNTSQMMNFAFTPGWPSGPDEAPVSNTAICSHIHAASQAGHCMECATGFQLLSFPVSGSRDEREEKELMKSPKQKEMEREEVSRGVVTSSRPPGAVTEPPAQSSAGTLGRARSGLGSRTRQPADHLSPAQTVAATSATPPSWPPTGGSTPGSGPSPVTSAGPFLPARGPAPASAHPHRGKALLLP